MLLQDEGTGSCFERRDPRAARNFLSRQAMTGWLLALRSLLLFVLEE